MSSTTMSIARQAYWRRSKMFSAKPGTSYPADYTPEEVRVLEAVNGKTLSTSQRVVTLVRAMQAGQPSRHLHLYDTFHGMRPPTDLDKDYLGNSAKSQLNAQDRSAQVWARAQIDEVRANMQATGYPQHLIHYIQGKVEDTIPGAIPDRIALLRLDTDWYESTRHELEHLYPRLVSGGVLILDDYGHWEVARKAVDEYIESHRLRSLLCRIDGAGRIAVKQ